MVGNCSRSSNVNNNPFWLIFDWSLHPLSCSWPRDFDKLSWWLMAQSSAALLMTELVSALIFYWLLTGLPSGVSHLLESFVELFWSNTIEVPGGPPLAHVTVTILRRPLYSRPLSRVVICSLLRVFDFEHLWAGSFHHYLIVAARVVVQKHLSVNFFLRYYFLFILLLKSLRRKNL